MMKLTKTKAKLLFTLILAFHVMAVQAEASRDDVRILIVGIRGDSRFSTADLLSGRKDGGQEDREIVKTPVITDEGRKMMLVTGPNLCEEDTARQSFTTALFLSSPGPHAVLVVLNLEDEESERCDVVKRAQELLGAEVLQYCIVLLHRNHQERFTGASRGIAGEMINACGGRFHMIRDSEPDQTAVLLAEIDKLVWLNGDGFYSVLTQELKTEETSQDVREENDLMGVIYDALGGAAGILGWIFLISLGVYTGGSDKMLFFGAKFAALLLFMNYLRYVLSPDVAIPLNLALASSLATTIERRQIIDFKCRRSSSLRDIIGDLIVNIFIYLLLIYAEFLSLPFILGSAVVSGTIISIRSWSDVLIACHAAPGVTFGAYAFILHTETISRESPVFALWSFLFCTIGAALSIGFVTVFDLLGVKMTIMLLISALTMACWHSKSDILGNGMVLSIFILLFPCGCALIGSVFLILGMIMSFLKVIIQNLVCSNLFYVALFLGSLIVIWRENGNNNTE